MKLRSLLKINNFYLSKINFGFVMGNFIEPAQNNQ